MARRQARLILLFEDRQHRAFLHSLVKGLGFDGRVIRELPKAAAKEGGAGYVLKTYPAEVGELRRKRKHQPALRLVVMIDADVSGVEGRLNELDKILEGDQQAKRQPDEGIIILV